MTETRYGKNVVKLAFDNDREGLYRQVAKLSGEPFGLDFQVQYGTNESENSCVTYSLVIK